MIHTKIMRNPHRPGQELSFLGITATPHGVNNADKYILEDIFSQVFVFYQEKDRRI